MTTQMIASVILYILFFSSVSRVRCESLRMELRRIDSCSNFSKAEIIQRAVQRSSHRVKSMASQISNGVKAPLYYGGGEYLMDIAIGTPPLGLSAIADTGSDLIWTQCEPCVECFTQATPIYDPKKSTTFAKLGCGSSLCKDLYNYTCSSASATTSTCNYYYGYADDSYTEGILGTETLTFESQPLTRIGFGCGRTNEGGESGGAGLVGLGRGPLSLVSQMGATWFSYCLANIDDAPSSSSKSILRVGSGDVANIISSHNLSSTHLIPNSFNPSFYYVTLKGITVGGKRLSIPESAFAINNNNGAGGVIIDSGTTITYLATAAYQPLKDELIAQMPLVPVDGSTFGLDLCFALPANTPDQLEVPDLVFNFDGGDLDLTKNYLTADENSNALCVAIDNSFMDASIFGNFQQQGMQVVYDLHKEMVHFVQANCD